MGHIKLRVFESESEAGARSRDAILYQCADRWSRYVRRGQSGTAFMADYLPSQCGRIYSNTVYGWVIQVNGKMYLSPSKILP